MDFTDKETVKQFIKETDIRDIATLNKMFKQMTGVFVEQMLEAERDEHLGYERHQHTREPKNNAFWATLRKGFAPFMEKFRFPDLETERALLNQQWLRSISETWTEIEDKVLSMYAKGMTVRDIQSHLLDIYGAEISPQTISNMTDQITPLVEEWRSRPLQSVYAIVYIDGLRYKVRTDGRIREKCVYGVMGIDLEGQKDMLGLWIFEAETAKGWLSVLTDLPQSRGS